MRELCRDVDHIAAGYKDVLAVDLHEANPVDKI